MQKVRVIILALMVFLVAVTGISYAAVSGEDQLEEEMLELVNAERVNAGLEPLIMDEELVQLARMKSQDMINENYFSHTSPTYGDPFTMMSNYEIEYIAAGENLAGNPSLPGAHQSLMNSPGHRANILNPDFTHIGIGVVKGGPYGMMITQMFITTSDNSINNSILDESQESEKIIDKVFNQEEQHNVTKENKEKLDKDDQIKVILNNKEVDFDIDPFISEANRVMVPIRFISEEMNYEVDWDTKEQKVSIKNDIKNITCWIGKLNVNINDKEVISDCSPELYKNRTMVPLRFVAETMNAQVVWDSQLREVRIIN